MNTTLKFGIAALGLLMAACSSDDAVPTPEPAPAPTPEPAPTEVKFDLSAAELKAARQTKEFNSSFFKAVNATYTDDENVVVSPLSAQVLLSMLANASSDAAAREIASALGCSDTSTLNSLSRKYLLALPNVDKDVKMALANSVWYDTRYELTPAFGTMLNEQFGTEACQRDFADTMPLVTEINRWCADNTNNLITHIIDNIDPTMMALMANAMYFNGAWSQPFDAAATTTATFNGTKDTADAQMMHNPDIAAYYTAGESYQAVQLPLGNGTFSVSFVLPDDGTDINAFLDGFNAADLNSDFKITQVDLTMPKFKFATPELQLEPALRTLGVNALFMDNNLRMFTTALTGNFSVSQKSTVEFNEKGAEASSVTWGDINGSAGEDVEVKPVKMTIDRPFLFFITERQTGACLMAGKIANL